MFEEQTRWNHVDTSKCAGAGVLNFQLNPLERYGHYEDSLQLVLRSLPAYFIKLKYKHHGKIDIRWAQECDFCSFSLYYIFLQIQGSTKYFLFWNMFWLNSNEHKRSKLFHNFVHDEKFSATSYIREWKVRIFFEGYTTSCNGIKRVPCSYYSSSYTFVRKKTSKYTSMLQKSWNNNT